VAATTDGEYRLAVDVGGTFIDYVLLDETSGEFLVEKQPAISERLASEFMGGLERLPVQPSSISRLFHGTTIGLNAILQDRLARVGLLTTAGFRDVLEVGRGGRPEMYNFLYVPPPPLVPRELRREVPERIDPGGRVLVPIDLEEVEAQVRVLAEKSVEAIAICFLHAYANPEHERQARERVQEALPGLPVTCSSDVTREWREFDRTSTTALNAGLRPLMGSYLSAIGDRLLDAGFTHEVALMQSSGGVISSSRAADLPVRTLNSGPAGGVIGAQALMGAAGHQNVICTDVGGTSYDVALIRDGEILECAELDVGSRSVMGAGIEIVSIGSGGGSVAWIDQRGALRVGPQSAGASPGPACFGRGGEHPTVTDAHLLLGHLDPDGFLGARMRLDVEAAQNAIEQYVCAPTGLSATEAADGILEIAGTNMSYAIRTLTVERGLDPRDFVMLAYGGGGGLFAIASAQELEIGTVIVPPAPANFSAWGILTADYREDVAKTTVRRLDEAVAGEVRGDLAELSERACGELAAHGFHPGAMATRFRADLRYAQQEHTVTIGLDAASIPSDATFVDDLRRRFTARHRELYGHGSEDAEIELVTLRCRAVADVRRPTLPSMPAGDHPVPADHREVYFHELRDLVMTPVYDREKLRLGASVEGPAVIEEWTTTILVPPGWQALTDRFGNLVMDRSEERRRA
jgi:N-methylhydantoinase A